ncbi:MAG: ATP-dependent DNA helicase RecG [Candidatus Saccharimonadales bacterium]
MQLDTGIDSLKGVGKTVASRFGQLGITTIRSLIDYYPRRYDDFSIVSSIKQLKPGIVSIKATILQASGRYARRGMHITEAVASDDSGSVRLVWFNQPYRATSLKHGRQYFISGIFELSHGHFVIMNPSIELVSDFPLSVARIVPVYRETKGLSSRQIRSALKQVVPLIRVLPETLPSWLVQENRLISYARAMEGIHFPDTSQSLADARERLGFNEVFSLSLASLLNKYEIMNEYAPIVPFNENVAKDFVSHLSFKLTSGQRKIIWQIYLDMQKNYPMNRLVEGDVGSGKTVVAAMAAVMVLRSGHQVAFMAPTEILAHQHFETLIQLLQPLGLEKSLGLLVGSMSPTQKRQAHQFIANGQMRFIVGTHALIQDEVDIRQLELIIIDEQHRFGVEQRKSLIAKAGHMPHVIYLSATPIPRSLALTLYGELDISILDTKPPGRPEIVTEICSPNSRDQLYQRIELELKAGHQMFVVCPLISDSVALGIHSVEEVFERLSKHDFRNYKIGLMHGKMKPAEKNKIMEAFVDHRLDILVSTTVIEVGVDIPNATVMLIENAEHFGLAQVHQLRGRIGRGTSTGYCYLMMGDSKPASSRLRAIERNNDGFKLAELDLELRGPGAIYGSLQHGQLDIRVAKLSDVKLIARARRAAQEFINQKEQLHKYSDLNRRVTSLRAVTNLN